jgi:peptidoglycan hydrolase-like protein with peptidoglycan-binding domain
VKKLQWYLIKIQRAPIAIGGHFGPLTKASSITFQTAHGLNANAVIDAKTWAALKSASTGP